MKALVISPQPFFSPRGTPLSIYYRTLVMGELGVKIDLLTYGEGEDVEIPGVRIIRIPRFAFLGNVKTGPSFLKLFLDIFIFLKTICLLLVNRYQFVHAHEEAAFMAYFLKPIFGFKLVYDMHSSLPQQLMNFQFSHSKLLIKIFETLENAALGAADVVITICEDLYHLVNKKNSNIRNHILIENSIFDPILVSAEYPNGHHQHGVSSNDGSISKLPKNKKIVLYAGTLEPYQGIEVVLRGFKEAIDKNADIFLVVVGGREKQVREYTALAERLGIAQDCLFTGPVSKGLAAKYLDAADVLLSPRIAGTNTPLKIYEQLASGKPIVATNIRSHTQVLIEEVAFLAEPDPPGLAKGIIDVLTSTDKAAQKAKNAKTLYRERYSRQVYQNKIQQVLEWLK
ncbi:MAG: glycosyltransferase [Calditrichaceae bacterium]|nr:glycosyltransferase [Calditrichia bacterium]NUQ40611.1 glycosyltransferase [Calditrichaceae bacterium]